MNNNNRDNVIRTIWLIVDILIWILSVFVLLSYKNNVTSLLTLCGILNIISYFLNVENYKIMGLISVISAFFVTKNLWQGVCVGLAVWKVLYYIYLTISYIIAKRKFN